MKNAVTVCNMVMFCAYIFGARKVCRDGSVSIDKAEM